MPPSPASRPSSVELSFSELAWTIFLSWFIPGAGHRSLPPLHRRRGLIYGIAIHLTFFMGLILHGGLTYPAWNPQDAAFNVVNNLTFLVQFFAGWPAVLSLMGSLFGVEILKAREVHAWFELGAFYCLVAGALNYFVVLNALDLARKKPVELLAEQQ